MGRYKLIRQLGGGRIAHIFLASDSTARRVVKQLHPWWMKEPHVREAFLSRARRAAELDHPNIGKVLDVGEAEGSAYAASEYVDGRTLRELMALARGAGQPIPLPLCAKIIFKACVGIEHAHARNVVHGHLTAGHLVIDRNGGVKVVDWGMAPNGEPADPDARMDLICLGRILRELLWDRGPFSAIPEILERIVEKAVEADPQKQYATCSAMRADLKRFIRSAGQSPGDGDLARLVTDPREESIVCGCPAPRSDRDEVSRSPAPRLPPGRPKAQCVHLAASAPRTVRSGQEFTARFCAYHPSLAEEVRRHLQEAGPKAKAHLDLAKVLWKAGTRITVQVSGAYLEASPASQEFTWQGEQHHLDFDVTVKQDAPAGDTRLKLDVRVDGFVLARLRIDLIIRSSAGLLPSQSNTRAYALATSPRTAFASYAEKDRPRVLDRVAALQIAVGLEVFMDCLSLHPNERWQARLATEIPARDVFMLFWSESAAKSRWVAWEWRLALKQKGLDAIQAHPLDPWPKAPLPRELSSLHMGDALMAIREATIRAVSAQ